MNYQGSRNISYQYPGTQVLAGSHASTMQRQSSYAKGQAVVQQQEIKPNFCTFDQKPSFQQGPPIETAGRAHSETRKKYSFEDEESDMPYSKKEYFLKGGDEVAMNRQRQSSESEKSLNGSLSRSEQDILEAKGGKKHGVTFDEKLEVHEVRNPHYGVDVKSEKREMKKKKKDKRKEEDIVMKVHADMKAKVQSQNMILYNVSRLVVL